MIFPRHCKVVACAMFILLGSTFATPQPFLFTQRSLVVNEKSPPKGVFQTTYQGFLVMVTTKRGLSLWCKEDFFFLQNEISYHEWYVLSASQCIRQHDGESVPRAPPLSTKCLFHLFFLHPSLAILLGAGDFYIISTIFIRYSGYDLNRDSSR